VLRWLRVPLKRRPETPRLYAVWDHKVCQPIPECSYIAVLLQRLFSYSLES
jgi:hypothetical protein